MRSKLAAIEPLAWATPAGFQRYVYVLVEHHVDFPAFAAYARAHPEAFERLGARIEWRVAPAVGALQRAIAKLPAIDAEDCKALSRRVLETRASPAEASLSEVLAASLPACAPLLGD